MADFTLSTNMNLPIPTVSIAGGPAWASLLDSCLTLLDGHSHEIGSGVPITPSAIDINADLSIKNNNLTNVRSVRFQPQPSNLALVSDIGCLYESGVDLWYNDGSGNQVRITQSGSIVGAAGNITGLVAPASATYVSANKTFVWQSDVNTPANIDGAALILRNITANSNGLTLQPPAAMAVNYSITLPSLPVAPAHLLSINGSGIISSAQGVIITTDIVDQNITQSKLALKPTGTTVGAGGIAVSTSSGSFSTSSSSLSTVATITITVTGRPVQVILNPQNSSSYVGLSGSSPSAFINFYRDATLIANTMFDIQGSTTQRLSPASFSVIDIVAAGTYTYTLQVAANSGTVSINNCNLMVYEK